MPVVATLYSHCYTWSQKGAFYAFFGVGIKKDPKRHTGVDGSLAISILKLGARNKTKKRMINN